MGSVRQAVMEERLVAGGSLAGWIRMVRKALNVESGKVDHDSVRERLKSLDTAWDKFDQAHQKLMNSEGHYKKEEMKEEWEKQMEEYCLVKEEAIATLKKSDNLKGSDKADPMPSTDPVPRPHHHDHHRHHTRTTHAPQHTQQQQQQHTTQQHTAQPGHSSQAPAVIQVPYLTELECGIRDDLVISGHQDFNSLYAANDTEQQSFTVNTLGAPNNSTTVCGCENINCPFCNIVMSIKNRDPDL